MKSCLTCRTRMAKATTCCLFALGILPCVTAKLPVLRPWFEPLFDPMLHCSFWLAEFAARISLIQRCKTGGCILQQFSQQASQVTSNFHLQKRGGYWNKVPPCRSFCQDLFVAAMFLQPFWILFWGAMMKQVSWHARHIWLGLGPKTCWDEGKARLISLRMYIHEGSAMRKS